MLKHRQYIYIYIFSCATLNETFTAKYDSVFALNTLIETKILSPPPPKATRRLGTSGGPNMDALPEGANFERVEISQASEGALAQSTKNSFPVVLRPHVFTIRSSNS